MSRAYQCRGCKGPKLPRPWPGERCPNCRRYYAWKEVPGDDIEGAEDATQVDGVPISLADVVKNRVVVPKIEIGIAGIDHVLDGGLHPRSLTLLCGEPGAGKSTAILQVLQALARQRISCLYVSGEEDVNQLAERAERLGSFPSRMQVVRETDLDNILYQLEEVQPKVAVIDSIQTIVCTNGSGDDLEPGSATSVKTAIREFMDFAKKNSIVFIVIGHVTKDGAIGGPNALMHYVDVNLYLAGKKTEITRYLRCDQKNRFGQTPRKARFTMEETGLVDHYKEDAEAEAALALEEKEALEASAAAAKTEAAEKARPVLKSIPLDNDKKPPKRRVRKSPSKPTSPS